MYKILLLMKRRPGLSVEAFRDYYERHHAPLAARLARGLVRYRRRYLDAEPPGATPPCDVITELWFEDEAAFRGTLAALHASRLPPEVIADEEKLFDRAATRIATIVECETELG